MTVSEPHLASIMSLRVRIEVSTTSSTTLRSEKMVLFTTIHIGAFSFLSKWRQIKWYTITRHKICRYEDPTLKGLSLELHCLKSRSQLTMHCQLAIAMLLKLFGTQIVKSFNSTKLSDEPCKSQASRSRTRQSPPWLSFSGWSSPHCWCP